MLLMWEEVPADTSRGESQTVIEQEVPQTGSEATWPVSSILQACRLLLKVGDPLGHRDMSGQPPNMGPGCQGREQGVNSQRAVMGDIVLPADFPYPQLLCLMISSQMEPVTLKIRLALLLLRGLMLAVSDFCFSLSLFTLIKV